MRTFESLEKLPGSQFKRLTGVSHITFDTMVRVVRSALAKRQARGGPRFRWSVENMVLMTLTYWREYRTYFHIGLDYDLSESQCFKTIKRVEDALIKDAQFHLKGKKDLLEKKEDGKYTVVDVAESPIERPKKTAGKTSKRSTTQAKRSATP